MVIVGYFKEILPCLICELKEGSNDYLQDTVCGCRTAGITRSCADDAGESGREQHADALRSLRVARADHQRNADQFDIRFAQAFHWGLNETQRASTRAYSMHIRCIFSPIPIGGSVVIGF